MNTHYQCTDCGQSLPRQGIPIKCPECGGVYSATLPPYNFHPSESGEPGIWKFKSTFGLPETAPTVYLGEGDTPLVKMAGEDNLYAKMESQNPTGSFKDRGAALFASFLQHHGIKEAVEDSSGNAGAAFAAYASASGISARIYVPASTSGPKLDQMTAYGADIRRTAGPRSASSEAVWKAIVEEDMPYASHNYLPHCLPANATIAYEIFQQLGQAPAAVIIPFGHGNLFLGIHLGFTALKDAGLIATLPMLMAVQTDSCSPLRKVLNPESPEPVEGPTYAEGIRIINPLRIKEISEVIKTHNYPVHFCEEADILAGHKALARKGIFTERTSAVVYDAYTKNKDKLEGSTVLLISGSGMKNSPL